MPDLTSFLNARISEDQAAAERLDLCPYAGGDPGNGAVHLSRNRVLAESEAKRRIIERITSPGEMLIMDWYPLLKLLAIPYADHPDFDETWRVE